MVYRESQNLSGGGFLSVSTPTPGCFSRKEDVRHTVTLVLVIEETEHNTVHKKTAVVISHLKRHFINLVFPKVI